MSKKIVYLAGPINGCDDSTAKDWREYAKLHLKVDGILDPMVRDHRGQEEAKYAEIVEGDKMNGDWDENLLARKLSENPDLGVVVSLGQNATGRARRALKSQTGISGRGSHKYNAQRTEYNGKVYPSKKQAEYARQLDYEVQAGEILYYLEEVTIRLPGGIKYRLDFLVVNVDGTIEWIETKGFKTEVYKLKKKLVESTYPVRIKEV